MEVGGRQPLGGGHERLGLVRVGGAFGLTQQAAIRESILFSLMVVVLPFRGSGPRGPDRLRCTEVVQT